MATQDVLRRTDILAPASGTVLNMRFRTVGGVIRPGEPVVDLVPKEDVLIVDARLPATDIDVVRAGLPAMVHLVPYLTRDTPMLEGVVTHVSRRQQRRPADGAALLRTEGPRRRRKAGEPRPERRAQPGHAGRGLRDDAQPHCARLLGRAADALVPAGLPGGLRLSSSGASRYRVTARRRRRRGSEARQGRRSGHGLEMTWSRA